MLTTTTPYSPHCVGVSVAAAAASAAAAATRAAAACFLASFNAAGEGRQDGMYTAGVLAVAG